MGRRLFKVLEYGNPWNRIIDIRFELLCVAVEDAAQTGALDLPWPLEIDLFPKPPDAHDVQPAPGLWNATMLPAVHQLERREIRSVASAWLLDVSDSLQDLLETRAVIR